MLGDLKSRGLFPKPYADFVARLRVPTGFLLAAATLAFSSPAAALSNRNKDRSPYTYLVSNLRKTFSSGHLVWRLATVEPESHTLSCRKPAC